MITGAVYRPTIPNTMNNNKSITVAFTGHRQLKATHVDTLANEIAGAIQSLYNKGYRRFMTGMADGFDLLAGETVLNLKRHCPDLVLIAVVPFVEQAKYFPAATRQRYREVLRQADETVVIEREYKDGCFLRRNDYLLQHCSAVVAYYDRRSIGGTYYTVRRAEKQNMPIYNLYQ